MELKVIGEIESVFHEKNGTPRQSGICPQARAKLTIKSDIYSNPEHSVETLELYSHLWLVFVKYNSYFTSLTHSTTTTN